MEVNYLTFGYLFLRLAPFILVCFFCLFSVFNKDFKGIVYLVGLLFACFLNVLTGNVIDFSMFDIITTDKTTPQICNLLTLGQAPISKLPLSQTVFGYTFMYLFYVIYTNNIILDNIFTIVFFSILIGFEWIWNITNKCHNIVSLIIAVAIGGGIGYLWAFIISSAKTPGLLYFMGSQSGSGEVCSVPKNQTFKCNVYKNGELISTM